MTEQQQARERWLANRFDLEKTRRKRQRNRGILPRLWKLFDELMNVFGLALKLTGMYNRGYRNALDIQLKNITLRFSNLPQNFDGYRILHLTDLHLDMVAGLENKIISMLANIETDLCVMTGDYRRDISGEFRQILKPLQSIKNNISASDGIFATLGNHDSYLMVKPMCKMGIKILTNETIKISRNREYLSVTGIDDVHYYFSQDAITALSKNEPGFKIALIHSPELFDVAAENGYSLYLCGHTHAGQICLPGGRPLITHLSQGKKFYRGVWKYKNMTGFTGSGTGTSGIPVRFNSQSEIALITLIKA